MKKIKFKNLPSQDTPVNAANVNKLQDNIEEVFNGVEPMGSIVVDDISCKNILINKLYSTTSGGITYTNNGDGSSTLNGTATASYRSTNSIIPLTNKEVLKAGTYTFSCENIKDTNVKIFISLYNMSDVTWARDIAQLNATTSSKTFTISNDYYVHIYFLVEAGMSVSNVRAYVQLEKGDIATPYTPHKEFSNKQTYSTNEQVIGTFEGKKLYRRVIKTTTASAINATKTLDTIANLQEIIKSNILWKTTGNFIYLTDNPSEAPVLFVDNSNNVIESHKADYFNDSTITVVLEYTKSDTSSVSTTSTEEEVI